MYAYIIEKNPRRRYKGRLRGIICGLEGVNQRGGEQIVHRFAETIFKSHSRAIATFNKVSSCGITFFFPTLLWPTV